MKNKVFKTSISLPKPLWNRAREKAKKDGFGNSLSAYFAKLAQDDLNKQEAA